MPRTGNVNAQDVFIPDGFCKISSMHHGARHYAAVSAWSRGAKLAGLWTATDLTWLLPKPVTEIAREVGGLRAARS